MEDRFMLDTHIFDAILSSQNACDVFSMGHKYYVCHIQKNEIDAINDPLKADKKAKLLALIKKINPEIVPTESFVLGFSALGQAKLGNGGYIEDLRKGNINNTKDALIGEAAIKNNCVLITDDDVLRKRVIDLGGKAISFNDYKNKTY
jgi:predicted nucleic acid-binding protein